jgi:hypothetical protein
MIEKTLDLHGYGGFFVSYQSARFYNSNMMQKGLLGTFKKSFFKIYLGFIQIKYLLYTKSFPESC